MPHVLAKNGLHVFPCTVGQSNLDADAGDGSEGVPKQVSTKQTETGADANEGMEVDNESDQTVVGPPEEHQAGVYVVLIFGQFLPRLFGVSSLILFI